MKIAVDAMGGDHAPNEVIKGCIEAITQYDIEIYLVGKEEKIKEQLQEVKFYSDKLHIIHASDIITNEDKPVSAIRKKKDASMVVGLNLLKENKVDAFVSAGNTGALLAGSLFRLGRIKGIDRPAISAAYPTSKGISLIVDAGANAECKPRNLLEFGLMGSVYMEKVLKKENPTIGLVNIGVEEGKGTSTIKDAFKLYQKTDLNFYGNAEARDLPAGVVDVIVCDGFIGNVILKLTEGVAITIVSLMKKYLMKNIWSKLGAAFAKGSLKEFKKDLDYAEYGGAPLLGVKGAVIKAHGSSNAKAIRNAIYQAMMFAENKVVQMISEDIIKIGDDCIDE